MSWRTRAQNCYLPAAIYLSLERLLGIAGGDLFVATHWYHEDFPGNGDFQRKIRLWVCRDFAVSANNCNELPPLTAGNFPDKGYTIVHYRQALWVIGGDACLFGVCSLNAETFVLVDGADAWQSGAPLPTGLKEFDAMVINDHIVVVGGSNANGFNRDT